MGHRRDDETEREIRTHLELEAEDRAAEGMAPQDAMYAARRSFGNVARTQEDVRAVWKWLWFDDALRDVKLGVRTLGRHPGFAAITILTLALGISATTCIFSVVNTVLLQPLPFKNPDRLVRIVEHIPAAESFRGVARRMPAMFEGEFDWWRGRRLACSDVNIATILTPGP